MVTNVAASLAVFCLLSGSLSSVDAWRSSYRGATQDVLWSSKNCNLNGGSGVVHGTVTDAICCNNTVSAAGNKCKDIFDKGTCEDEDTCKWKRGMGRWGMALGQGKCVLNRDRKNNVCCQEVDVKQNCVDMMAGRCPTNWQLPGDCCPAPYNKFAGILSTDPTQSDLVCCNAPCKAIEVAWAGSEGNLTAGIAPVAGKAHCNAAELWNQRGLAKKCAPGERGYMQQMMNQYGMGSSAGYGGYGGGMDTNMLSQLMGMPVSKPQSIGQIIPGMGPSTGLDGGLTLSALQNMGFGSSKDNHVDEITVDDFFDAIIEALDNDKDVFEYNKEINSDSWFGKQSFGGLVDGFSFIDPSKFLNQIYGSPFGLANAQAMYGMQYGISQDKFKTPDSHQLMTGFQSPYGSPYGQSPYGQSPYGPAPSPYGPPTPPAYAPPQYNPHGPPPPPQPAYPEQPPAYTEAPVYTEAPPAYTEATSEQPAYTEAPPPAYPQDPYQQQPQQYPQPQYDYYGQQPSYGAPQPGYQPHQPAYGAPPAYHPTQAPYHPTQAPYHPTQAPYHPTQAPYHPTHAPAYEYPSQPQYHQQPSYGQLPGYQLAYGHPTQAPYHPQPAYAQPASYGPPPPAYPQQPAYPEPALAEQQAPMEAAAPADYDYVEK